MKLAMAENYSSGAKQAAEKGLILGKTWQEHTSRAEARIDSIDFIPGMNPRPTDRLSFSATCKARWFLLAIYGTAEAVPFQDPTFTTGC